MMTNTESLAWRSEYSSERGKHKKEWFLCMFWVLPWKCAGRGVRKRQIEAWGRREGRHTLALLEKGRPAFQERDNTSMSGGDHPPDYQIQHVSPSFPIFWPFCGIWFCQLLSFLETFSCLALVTFLTDILSPSWPFFFFSFLVPSP